MTPAFTAAVIAFWISRCELTPISLRNLRTSVLTLSSFTARPLPYKHRQFYIATSRQDRIYFLKSGRNRFPKTEQRCQPLVWRDAPDSVNGNGRTIAAAIHTAAQTRRASPSFPQGHREKGHRRAERPAAQHQARITESKRRLTGDTRDRVSPSPRTTNLSVRSSNFSRCATKILENRAHTARAATTARCCFGVPHRISSALAEFAVDRPMGSRADRKMPGEVDGTLCSGPPSHTDRGLERRRCWSTTSAFRAAGMGKSCVLERALTCSAGDTPPHPPCAASSPPPSHGRYQYPLALCC